MRNEKAKVKIEIAAIFIAMILAISTFPVLIVATLKVVS